MRNLTVGEHQVMNNARIQGYVIVMPETLEAIKALQILGLLSAPHGLLIGKAAPLTPEGWNYVRPDYLTASHDARWEQWKDLPADQTAIMTEIIKNGYARLTEVATAAFQQLLAKGLIVVPNGFVYGHVACLTLHGWNFVPGGRSIILDENKPRQFKVELVPVKHPEWDALTEYEQKLMGSIALWNSIEDKEPHSMRGETLWKLHRQEYLSRKDIDRNHTLYFLTRKGALIIPDSAIKKARDSFYEWLNSTD